MEKSKRRYKKILSRILVVLLIFGSFLPVPAGGVRKVQAAEEVSVQFEQSYVKPGETLTVAVTGISEGTNLTYTWSLDGKTLQATGSSYTPADSDLQKMLKVEVYAEGNKTAIGSAQMFISKIPVVYVNTENNVGITSKEDYVNADMKIQGNEAYNTNLYQGGIEIRGRGNATWSNPKKPYKLKLNSSTDLFGMGKSKHWVLLANYVDPSLLRNKVSYDFSGAMGMPYMQSVHVELILNGQYLGNYQFCEQVKLEPGRVNITGFEDKVKDAAKAISKKTGVDKDSLEDAMMENLEWVTSDSVTFGGQTYKVSDYCEPIDITGGYLLELDYYDDEVSQILTSSGKRVKFKNPEYAKTNKQLYQYVSDYLNAFESAVYSSDFHTDYNGEKVHYSELFDMDSLVKFWMVQEVFFNWDGMNNSNYIYKDVNGRMHFGPIWDMDLTAGSNSGTTSTTTWQTFGFSHWQHPNQWYRSITKDPYFIVQAYQYYHEIRDTLIEDMRAEISTLEGEIRESAQANLNLWHGGQKYDNLVNSLTNWMTKHLRWMDEQFASPETMIASLGQYKEYGYAPDQKIQITVDEEEKQVTVIAPDASEVACYVNGKSAGTGKLTNGSVVLPIAEELLMTDGSLNTVQVFKKDSGGTLGASNFATFASEATDPKPVEDVLTGDVWIAGNPVVNATLSVKTANLNDTDVFYQWMADGQPLTGETGEYYFVTSEQKGKRISVSVTGAQKKGNLVSDPTGEVLEPAAQKERLVINQVMAN